MEEDKDNNVGNGNITTEQLLQQLAEAQEESRTNLSGWQRAQADFENFKRRKENEAQELIIFAREVTIAKLLPTLDSLEQGLKHIPKPEMRDTEQPVAQKFIQDYQNWQTGIQGTLQQLEKALEELGVKRIAAVGKKFDPHYHEAIREVPGDEDGIVIEEFQAGYELNGKVIRPSQVAISKKG